MRVQSCLAATIQFTVLLLWTFSLLAAGGHELMAQNSQGGSQGQAAEVDRLIAIIRDKELRETDPQRVVEAIQELGRRRAVAAIDDLVNLLTFKLRYDWEDNHREEILSQLRLTDNYPASGALFQIGEPALPALARAIAKNEIDSLKFQNARDTVMAIFRDRLPQGAKYLREQASHADSPLARERLNAAAQYIEDFVATWYPPDKRP